MTEHACSASVKEYPSDGGVLLIESFTGGGKKKSCVIMEILMSMTCPENNAKESEN